MDNEKKIEELFNELRVIQKYFNENYLIDDIYSNSKIYEFLAADRFGHTAIPGHSGSRDAIDKDGNEVEYKHFKASSSNHTWTFNDFSDTTISNLRGASYVYFIYVDDINYKFPGQITWYYKCTGVDISNFLAEATLRITNKRKMINVSKRNLNSLGYNQIMLDLTDSIDGIYSAQLKWITRTVDELENLTYTNNLLTSNKIWELLVALKLNHFINSEQGGREGAHDAYDDQGNLYEYKISKNKSWNFQDISVNVLNKYLDDKAIILAVVDKTNMQVKKIYTADPQHVVNRLKEKLQEKIDRFTKQNKEIRRLQVSLSSGDLKKIMATRVL